MPSSHSIAIRAWFSMRYYRAKHRTLNSTRDLWDRHVRGYCCAAPSGLPDSPGYHFWRCGLKHGHDGAHRFVNYLWSDSAGEKVPAAREHYSVYAPRDGLGAVRLDRYPTLTRRQKRQRDAWHEMKDRERRANHG